MTDTMTMNEPETSRQTKPIVPLQPFYDRDGITIYNADLVILRSPMTTRWQQPWHISRCTRRTSTSRESRCTRLGRSWTTAAINRDGD